MGRRHFSAGLAVTTSRLFVLLGIACALAIIVFRAQSLGLERAHLIQQRQAQAVTLAQFASTYSARLYDQSSRIGSEVGDYIKRTNPSPETLRAYLKARAADTSQDDYIVVVGADGRVKATSEAMETDQLKFDPVAFAARWAGSSREIVPVLRSRLTGKPIYSFSLRLEDAKGDFAGVVGVNVRPEGIQPVARRRPEDPILTIWGKDGRFIAASFVDFDANGVAIEPKKPPGSGIPGAPSRVGHNDIAATASVPSWPLIAAASFDRQGVLASWRRDLYETFVLIGLALIGIGGLVWFGVRTANREDEAKRAYQKANEIANAALLSRDLLMKEVHHRVKNSLLMTASLIYLQEKRFEDPHMREAFESTRQRLTSIGLVHEALYSGSSLEAVAIGAYLRRLLDDIGQALGADDRGVVLYLEAEALLLPAHQVTPVGLIVAEVVTNAFKHAFGPNGAGTINVRVGLSNTNEVKVEVSDNGRGYVGSASDSSSGLGTRLIRSLTSQLGGVTSMTNESGATFRLCFPCEARTAPET